MLSFDQKQRFYPPSAKPQVNFVNGTEHHQQAENLQENGYVLIGYSSFQSSRSFSLGYIENQALNVGADTVLFTKGYDHSENTAIPVYNSSTTTETGTANSSVYGSYGSAYGSGSYSGSSTTSSLNFIPYQYSVYSRFATYWRKSKPGILGVIWEPIPSEVRTLVERNTGVYVNVVVNNSPAFYANIVKGDVIIKVGEKEILGPDFTDVLNSYAGQKVTLKILRNKEEKNINVQLNTL